MSPGRNVVLSIIPGSAALVTRRLKALRYRNSLVASVDESLFTRKLEHTLGLYLYFKAAPVFDSVTLVSAGERKGNNRLGVYNGGWVMR